MSVAATLSRPPLVVYPESDGQPMAENTLQFQWIVTIKEGFENLFRDDPQVFVAGDLLWYPLEGNNTIRQAPDAMVVFGRPKGHRGSYRQWEENQVAPQAVWEVLSPGNRPGEQIKKFAFYERHGVEEYFVYDPDRGLFSAWERAGQELREVENPIGWTSPLLGVRFEMEGSDLVILRPDGRRFITFTETCEQLDHERERADAERLSVEKLLLQLREAGLEPKL